MSTNSFDIPEYKTQAKVMRVAIADLKQTAGNMQQGVYAANKEVYTKLKYSHPVADDNGENVGV